VKLLDVLLLLSVRYPVDDPPEVLVLHVFGELGDGDDVDVVGEGRPEVVQIKHR
jgi:hypothetical protein